MALGFKHPFTCTIAGPTQSGKTEFVKKLLKCLPYYVTPCPTKVFWAYGVHNETQFKSIQNICPIPIEFIEGIPSLSIFSSDERNLIIFDDLMHDAGKSKLISELFTKGCHHKNISVILILQNLFHQAKVMRDIHTSTNYMVLFKNPRDSSQITNLERQCFPLNPKFLRSAYEQACKLPYGYLVIDFHQTTPDLLRLSSGIFPPEITLIYKPCK
jgi:hypothetical protein